MMQYAQSIDVIFVITSNSDTPHTSIIKYMHTRFNHSMATYLSISPLSLPYIFSPLPNLDISNPYNCLFLYTMFTKLVIRIYLAI